MSDEVIVRADVRNLSEAPAHILGPVTNDWEAIEEWLGEVAAEGSEQTIATYRFHFAKYRWYCDHVARLAPSSWTTQEIKRFREFLKRIPDDALCVQLEPIGKKNKVGRFAIEGEAGWTPFRRQPSESSQADILRFVHSLYNALYKSGYMRVNPMALTKTRSARKINAGRAIAIDLYALVLDVMEQEEKTTFMDRQLYVRDRFVFEALRGLGLRASELIKGQMTAFEQVTAPKTGARYWTFHVTEETGKGNKERWVPVSKSVWEAFVTYRAAFGLPAVPAPNESMGLVLSPRTKGVVIGKSIVMRSSSRRFFGAWREVTTRHGLYAIVKGRLAAAAERLTQLGRTEEADRLQAASPHWLRHTFSKASLLTGQDLRSVAGALGHADLSTVMIYTQQEALDLIAAWERVTPGIVATEI